MKTTIHICLLLAFLLVSCGDDKEPMGYGVPLNFEVSGLETVRTSDFEQSANLPAEGGSFSISGSGYDAFSSPALSEVSVDSNVYHVTEYPPFKNTHLDQPWVIEGEWGKVIEQPTVRPYLTEVTITELPADVESRVFILQFFHTNSSGSLRVLQTR